MRRGKVIILHKRDLVASQWSPGQILGNSGCELPERKRHRKQFRSRANVQRDCPQKLLVGVDLRTTKFIVGPRHRGYPAVRALLPPQHLPHRRAAASTDPCRTSGRPEGTEPISLTW